VASGCLPEGDIGSAKIRNLEKRSNHEDLEERIPYRLRGLCGLRGSSLLFCSNSRSKAAGSAVPFRVAPPEAEVYVDGINHGGIQIHTDSDSTQALPIPATRVKILRIPALPATMRVAFADSIVLN
jgi:hypothetical protein